MKLKSGETVWKPKGMRRSLICVLAKGQNPPANVANYLSHQTKILERLIQEAKEDEDDVEIREAEDQIETRRPHEIRMMLPPKFLHLPDGPRLLMEDLIPNLADSGSPQRERINAAMEAIRQQAETWPQEDAREYAEELSLGQFVGELIVC